MLKRENALTPPEASSLIPHPCFRAHRDPHCKGLPCLCSFTDETIEEEDSMMPSFTSALNHYKFTICANSLFWLKKKLRFGEQ